MTNYYLVNDACEINVTINKELSNSDIESLINKLHSDDSFKRIIIFQNSDYEDNIDIIGMYEADFQNNLICGKCYDYDCDKPSVVLSEYSIEALGYTHNITGENIEKNGVEFKVAGIHSFTDGFCVPIKYYLNNYKAEYITVTYDSYISTELVSALENSKCMYNIVDNDNPFNSSDFVVSFIQILIIFCVSFINIMMMISFLGIKMNNTLRVYYICGCKSIHKFFIIFSEVSILSVLGLMIGFGLFAVLFNWFGSLELVYSESIIYYIYILIITLFILLAFSWFFSLKKTFAKQDLRNIKE